MLTSRAPVAVSLTAMDGRPGHTEAVRRPFLWEDGQMKDINELTNGDIDIGDGIGATNNADQIVTGSGYILLPIP